MVASEVVVASVVKPVGRRVVPGRSVPEGVDPSSEGSLLSWLQSHEGKIGENAVAYAAKIEGGGFTDLYSIGYPGCDILTQLFFLHANHEDCAAWVTGDPPRRGRCRGMADLARNAPNRTFSSTVPRPKPASRPGPSPPLRRHPARPRRQAG